MDSNLLKVLIVDDEKDARRLIRFYLENIPDIGLIEESETIEDALFKTFRIAPDLIFLNILMPGGDGAELLELIEKRKLNSHIVVSGTEESAIRAIKNHLYEFLLSPVKQEDITGFIAKFLEQRKASLNEKMINILTRIDDGQKIRLSSTNSYVIIAPSDIVYCEAEGSYTVLYMENGTKEIVNNYLGSIEKNLSGRRFFRIGRSYLINLDKLSKINRGDHTCTLEFRDRKVKMKVSRTQIKILSEMDFE